MTQDEMIELAIKCGWDNPATNMMPLYEFGKLVAEKEREVVANWIMDRGFATGHGDSIVDLLDQLEWQIAEKEREACAKVLDQMAEESQNDQEPSSYVEWIQDNAEAIRARGQA